MIEPAVPRATRAYHDFLRRAKGFWARDLYQAVRRDYAALAADVHDADEAERRMRSSVRYRYFGWLERNLQHFKYSSPRGIVATVAAQRPQLASALEAAGREGVTSGRLRLKERFELPRYYSSVEFHQHPGGVWSDALAGIAYDFGRRTTMPAHLDPDEIHRRFAAAVPDGPYRRILDLGCGTGRSTLPFAARFPGAELHGVDLSAPCLIRAFERSRAAGIEAIWSQQNAEALEFPDGYFDLVHSTFLLHELPRHALRRITAEVLRVLAPGGRFVSLDFHSPPGGVFGDFIHYGHARRNDEVFMRAFAELDYLAMQRDLGFESARMLPFDDGSGVYERDRAPDAWRFPSQLFVAVKGH